MANTEKSFTKGQKVRFNVGRGRFEGKVVSYNKETQIATVQRLEDKKTFERKSTLIRACK